MRGGGWQGWCVVVANGSFVKPLELLVGVGALTSYVTLFLFLS